MKKSLLFMLAVLCCIFTALTFTACAEHVHEFTQRKESEKYLVSEATCTEKATYYFSCICGETGTETFKGEKPLGHDVGNWNILKEPTDTEKGFKTRKCTRTGCEYFENREIPVLHDHIFTNYISDNNATCEKDGTKTATCDFSGCDETDVVTIENSKLPHTFNKQVATEKYLVSPATCTQKAKYYYSCDCGKTGTETFEHGRTKAHSVVIDKAVKATTTADGLTEGKHCSVCGTVLAEQKVVYATGSLGLTYDGGTVTGIGTCTDADIFIPKYSPKGVLVTSIGEKAFSFCYGLTSVTIGKGVTSIGEYAFEGCERLKNVTIPESVISIGDGSFYKCEKLIGIEIPDSVTSIGDSAFLGCVGFTSVTIGDGVTVISDSAFAWCTGLKDVTIGNSVTFIGTSAFEQCYGLKNITIGNSVTFIADYVFRGCVGLTSVTIGSGVTSIGFLAFENCSELTSITVTEGNKKYHSKGDCLIETVSKTLILGCKNSAIPSDGSVTFIGYRAFDGCTGLTSIEIPDSVTSIDYGAFDGCTGLTSIEIPNSVTSIGDFAFDGCFKLVEVINNSTLEITKGSYDNGRIAYYALTVKNGGKSDIVNKNGYLFYTAGGTNYLLGYDGNETRLILPENYNGEPYQIYNYAFDTCTKVMRMTIGSEVTSIGNFAFFVCHNLTRIDYKGTKAQWNAISKSHDWDNGTGYYTVYCTDGSIRKG